MIEVEKESSPIQIMQEKYDIERQKSNNKKDGLIMERTTRIEDKGMIRKGIVKEMLEKIERQNDNTLKLANIEALLKKLDIERDIEKERHTTRKEIEKERHNSRGGAKGGEGGQLPPLTLLPNPCSIGYLDYFAPQWQSHLKTKGALASPKF